MEKLFETEVITHNARMDRKGTNLSQDNTMYKLNLHARKISQISKDQKHKALETH